MKNIDNLLKLADEQAKADMVMQLRAPASLLAILLKERVRQMEANPAFARVADLGREWGEWS